MLSAAFLLLATYVADIGPISGQPVELDTCSYVHNMAQTRYGYRVSYTNTSDVAADMIRIHVYWHGLGDDQYLRDVGKFTSNVEVSHTFAAPQIFASGLTCVVDSVHFVDGSTCKAPIEQQ